MSVEKLLKEFENTFIKEPETEFVATESWKLRAIITIGLRQWEALEAIRKPSAAGKTKFLAETALKDCDRIATEPNRVRHASRPKPA